MPTPTASLVRKSTFMFLSMSIAGVLALLISIFIVSQLGKSEYGMYSIVTSMQAVVSLLGSFSIGTAITKYVAEYRARDEEQALRFAKSGLVIVLAMVSAVSLIYVALSGLIGSGLYDEPAIVHIVPFSALMVVGTVIFSTSVGIVQGCQRFRLMATAQIAYPLISLILISLLLPAVGLKGIFLGYFLSQLTVSIVVLVLLSRSGFNFLRAPLELRRRSDTVSKLLSFALPAGLSGLVAVPLVWIANTELNISAGFQANAYFGVAYVVFVSLMQIPSAISIPLMPRVSELTVGNHDDIEGLLMRTMRTLSITLFPLLFAVALFSSYIVEIFYGLRYSASADAMYLMASTGYFYTLCVVIGSFITGMGRMRLVLGLNVLWAAAFLVFVFMGVPMLGANGLALSYLAAYCILLVFTIIVSRKFLHLSIRNVHSAIASSTFFFVFGFFAQSTSSSHEFAVRLGLLMVGVVYFCLIGQDVVKPLYARAMGILHRSRFSFNRSGNS